MMKIFIRQILIYLSLTATLIGMPALANALETEQELENSKEPEENNNGGYLKIGVGFRYQKGLYTDKLNGLGVFFSGRYQWHGLYLEVTNNKQRLDAGASFGYNFYNTEHWSFDLNVHSVHGDQEGVLFFRQNDQLIFPERNSATMVGLRATGRFEQTSVQFSISPYSSNYKDNDGVHTTNNRYDDALHASFWLDRSWQLKNWQFNAAFGVTYFSEDILNYYYGTPIELYDDIPEGDKISSFEYQASSGIDVTAQVGVSYPISQHWIFESYARYTDVADSITDSPFIQRWSTSESRIEFGALVSYVF